VQALEHNGLANINPSKWVSQQSFLNVLKEVNDEAGAEELYQLGEAFGSQMSLPISCKDFQDVLKNIGLIYRFCHRGIINESIHCHPDGEFFTDLISETPYPDRYEQGIFMGILSRFLKPPAKLQVQIDLLSPQRELGNDFTTYLISW
jgi:hypothetical protein